MGGGGGARWWPVAEANRSESERERDREEALKLEVFRALQNVSWQLGPCLFVLIWWVKVVEVRLKLSFHMLVE